MEEIQEVVKEGDYVILQKQNYTKVHRVKKSVVTLGKDEVDISAIVGEPYWTTYKMEPKANSKRCYVLKKSKCAISITDEIIKDLTSGVDNREIIDDGSSQKLSTQEIISLRECGMSAQDIVSQLIENSKTFMNKTEYSQEKYLKKKEKKYFEYITIRKPTFRLIAEVFLRQPTKVLSLRMDTLAQITTIAGVKSGGTYILYENGCLGLVAAALLNQLGREGNIIHIHPGCSDHPTQAVLALNLPRQQLNQLVSLNIQKLCLKETEEAPQIEHEAALPIQLGKRKFEDTEKVGGKMRKEEGVGKALEILREKKADGLIIVGKEHPSNIFKKLVTHLNISRPFVVYCPVREPLQELYVEVKQRTDVIAVRLTESWLRDYQVLPDRTHPDIRISGSGGYLLSEIHIVCPSDSRVAMRIHCGQGAGRAKAFLPKGASVAYWNTFLTVTPYFTNQTMEVKIKGKPKSTAGGTLYHYRVLYIVIIICPTAGIMSSSSQEYKSYDTVQ